MFSFKLSWHNLWEWEETETGTLLLCRSITCWGQQIPLLDKNPWLLVLQNIPIDCLLFLLLQLFSLHLLTSSWYRFSLWILWNHLIGYFGGRKTKICWGEFIPVLWVCVEKPLDLYCAPDFLSIRHNIVHIHFGEIWSHVQQSLDPRWTLGYIWLIYSPDSTVVILYIRRIIAWKIRLFVTQPGIVNEVLPDSLVLFFRRNQPPF